MSDFPHVIAGLKYADNVINGRIQACDYVRKACQRQIDDLDRDDFEYRFDLEKAERICKFVSLLPHTKGIWARRREKIRLEPFQSFILSTIFGWINKETGNRRYTEAYSEIPRKNGKSVLAAGVGNYCFSADGEYGAEVYCGATTEQQAWEVFRPARLMALNTPELQSRFEITVRKKTMSRIDGSRFEPLIGKPGDGSSPSCAIIDEYHEHQTNDLYETMETGVLAREQPLIFIITTAGKDISGPCYLKRDEAIKVLEGTVQNENLFAIIYTIDDPEKWDDPDALRMANPNFGISANAQKLLQSQQTAIIQIEKQVAFKTKHLNLWVNSGNPWVNIDKWKKLIHKGGIESFAYDGVIQSLDLASRQDICARGKLFFRVENSELHMLWAPTFYLPENSIKNDKTGKYKRWVKLGLLIALPGDEIRHDEIKREILEDAERYGCDEFAYDPWRATKLAQELEDDGITCVEIGATAKNFSPAMYEIESAIEAKRIWHMETNSAGPMSWMLSNVVVQKDRRDNIYPRKEKVEMKIDGPVAMIMACSRALAHEGGAATGELMVV